MVETIRKCGICMRGGILAAFAVAAMFASVQVACLTHDHCREADCFDRHEETRDHSGDRHHDHDDHGESCLESEAGCCDGHHDHDIHHHSHEGHAHPQRRFTVSVYETPFDTAAEDESPGLETAERPPDIGGSPPLDTYGPIFAGRAPPLA
jgi:hypothetical protein